MGMFSLCRAYGGVSVVDARLGGLPVGVFVCVVGGRDGLPAVC